MRSFKPLNWPRNSSASMTVSLIGRVGSKGMGVVSYGYVTGNSPRVQTEGLGTHLCRGNSISWRGGGSWFKHWATSAPSRAMELLPCKCVPKPSVWARGENNSDSGTQAFPGSLCSTLELFVIVREHFCSPSHYGVKRLALASPNKDGID